MFEELLRNRYERFNVHYGVYGETLKQARSRAQVDRACFNRTGRWRAAPMVPNFDLPFPDGRDYYHGGGGK